MDDQKVKKSYLKNNRNNNCSKIKEIAMTEQEISEWKAHIDKMSQTEMARLYRSAPVGHPIFRADLPLFDYFKERFKKLGGMTPEISKKIGW